MHANTPDGLSQDAVTHSSPAINEVPADSDAAQLRNVGQTTPENVNYARISCLLVQEGTKRMQAKVIENLPERQTFGQVLLNKKPKLQELAKSKFISKAQFDTLFPSADVTKIDIPVWFVLARNITVKSSRKGIDWGKSPDSRETHWAHDFLRLREFRNFLCHVSAPELTSDKFNEIKLDLIRTLKRLGTDNDVIEHYMTRDLDPQQTKMCQLQIREQYMAEQNVLLLKSAEEKKHIKIFTGVLVILAALVVVGVSVPVAWYYQQKAPCTPHLRNIVSDSGILRFMSREGWDARPRTTGDDPIPPLKKPVKMAVVFHTAFVHDQCKVIEDCCDQVRTIQDGQMAGGWDDIAYNYLIGDDGVVYEGRGSSIVGGAVWQRNSEMVSIALMGNFVCAHPSKIALMALYVFLEYITEKDPLFQEETPILDSQYELYGHCQVNLQTPEHNKTFPDAPGAATMHELMYWKHWKADNITHCDMNKDCMQSSLCCKSACNQTINVQ